MIYSDDKGTHKVANNHDVGVFTIIPGGSELHDRTQLPFQKGHLNLSCRRTGTGRD